MQIFLICLLIKQQKHVADKQLFNHTFYETNFKPKLFTANVECNGTVIKLPKTEKPILFLNFKTLAQWWRPRVFGSLSTSL